ncbi:3-methyladenine DNA glycosylase [Amycolatopsis tucumanensis]|uniref:3-methyladenine DNA glycosylase n=1 Tax=Amycolatopsis tucumanensis TaxID=401106 RepID=A0ABP7J039_9PSEU|nr:3-methyladenine DNA glycosylase [Amycolatopsis tucumanensis]MCF6422308.1 3-methyladenine DNA glycosylase [Amycolatopsis tucumanensis]
MRVLAEDEWRARQREHAARVRRWTGPYQERRSRGEKHPVHDFLFQYYPHRPAHLERWSPGPGVVLAGTASEFLARPEFRETADGVVLGELPAKRVPTVRALLVLLEATASRPPRLNCFGLHEWAMVYRQAPGQVRHNQLPLRLGTAGTDTVVESLELRCGHYDAFRFFTPPARPRNALEPSRERQVELEQPGCLHANMDLYRAAFKLDPFVPSELVADCFELAVEIRELDMRASPYDLSGLGYSPVRIETARGRAEYARAQAAFAARAEPLRARLIEHCRTLLAQGQ